MAKTPVVTRPLRVRRQIDMYACLCWCASALLTHGSSHTPPSCLANTRILCVSLSVLTLRVVELQTRSIFSLPCNMEVRGGGGGEGGWRGGAPLAWEESSSSPAVDTKCLRRLSRMWSRSLLLAQTGRTLSLGRSRALGSQHVWTQCCECERNAQRGSNRQLAKNRRVCSQTAYRKDSTSATICN